MIEEPTVQEAQSDETWETPGYVVVDTALEVTAYALTDL
ncbi:pyrroloquinoline quinone precursor peptide PqqA [Streptomyces sp. NPDC051940]